jgi:hypothetical protein
MTDDGGIGPPAWPVSPSQRALLTAAFRLILGTGTAVAPSQLAVTTGLAASSVRADLAELAAAGRVRLADTGEVQGSLGLTVIRTRHEVRVGQAAGYTWCALDAVGILGALASDGRIASVNGVTGTQFGIDFTAGLPAGHDQSWVLFVAANREVTSVIDQWCPLVNFFEDADTASSWAARYGVVGQCLTIEEATRFGSGLWREALGI